MGETPIPPTPRMAVPSHDRKCLNNRDSLMNRVPCARTLAAIGFFGGLLSGCANVSREVYTPPREEYGLILILPGIEGKSVWNRDLAHGLDDGGVASAIEVHDWTTGLPGGFMFNLTDYERNREQATRVARRILEFRDRHPGRPVHLIGHSGGGGIAIMALEALPPGRQIDAAILLAPALSPEYDLTIALRRTRHGVHNFYSKNDVSFLKLGTSLFGSIDREYGASAGAVGFRLPGGAPPDTHRIYSARLHQVAWDSRLAKFGASGSHVGWASARFAREYLAALIRHNEARKPLSRRDESESASAGGGL
ncbi:Alpha/beta hydrolase family protein [Phycisphaerae bacterium RAS1]|nr:Alpha/beta hydrolase family protein [Phycisphaerae bacterium RAS1]